MKKLTMIIILILFIPIYGYSYTNTNNNKYRLTEITKYIQKEGQIVSMVENYIFLTGDTNVTTDKLETFFELDKNFFKGVKNNIDLSINNGILVLKNALQSVDNKIDEKTKDLYNKYKNQNSYLKDNDIYVKLSENSKKAINFLKTLPNTYVVENNKNSEDISIASKKLTYNGNGFQIKQFDKTTNKWHELGYYDFDNKKGIIVNNTDDLLQLNDIDNGLAYVIGSNGVTKLHSTNDGWQSTDVATGDFFVGDGTIFDAACKIYNYDGGSKITINPDKEPYIDSIQSFTRVDDTDGNGYWINDNKNMLIIKDSDDVKYINTVNSNIDNVFICSPNRESYYVLNNENFNGSNTWIMELNTMQDMLNFNGDYMSNQWFFVKNDNIYFQKIDNIFYSKYKKIFNNNISFTDYIVGAGTRDIFNNILLSDNKTYLTTLDDCSVKNNCSGATTAIFGGEKIDGLYKWNKVNNELQDVAISTLSEAYKNGYSYFYDNNKHIYFKKILDNNNNFCYQDINGKEIVMENGSTLNNDFINYDNNNNIQITMPLSDYNCANNLNNKFKSGNYKNYMNNIENTTFIELNSLSDLKNWNINSNIKNVLINNKLYTYDNNQWQSYDSVFVKGNRNNLVNFDNGNDKLFYTTDLDDGDTYNNGYLDKDTNLYVWEYEPDADKQLKGFIDIYRATDIKNAYSNLKKIYKDFYIGNDKFYKESMNDNSYNIYCIKDNNNNFVSGQNKIISNTYIDGNIVKFPVNTTCENVNIDNNQITIDNFDRLKNLDYSNVSYLYNNNTVKIEAKNNLLYDNNYIVIGDRNNFNIDKFSSLNLSNVYTTVDDSNINSKINIFGNNKVYKWDFYKDITGYNNVNKLVENFQPKNCMDILNILHIQGNQIIYDNKGNSLNVECGSNGETILSLKQLNNNITFNVVNNNSSYSFDKNNLSFKFDNNSENELVMNIDIPINYSKIKINNFSFTDSNQEAQFSDDYKIAVYKNKNDIFNDFINKIKEIFETMFNKNSSNETNYIAIGLLNNNSNLLNEIDKDKTINNIYYNNSGNIKLEIFFNNEDSTSNTITLNNNTTFSLLP